MGKYHRNKVEQKTDNLSQIILFLVLFFVVYVFSFIVTSEYLGRKAPVSLEEEANYSLSYTDIQDLYNKEKKLGTKDSILILGYHQVRDVNQDDTEKARLFITSPESFEKQMKFLKENGYETISLTEYLDYTNFRKFLKTGEKKVVITFDDGYISQFENAFPILKKYDFSATFFIYADCIEKYSACMTWDNLKELTNANMKIANHSLHHLYLPELRDYQIKKEIKENEIVLKEKLGEESFVKFFAYPFGASNESLESIIEDLGYLGGVGVFPGFYKKDVGDLYIHRYLLGQDEGLFEELFK